MRSALHSGLSLGHSPAQANFSPGQIAAVAAGYWWDPRAATGLGTANAKLPEMNGKTSYDMIAPSLATAPSATSTNSRPTILFTNGSPDQLLRIASAAQLGWTGATYSFAWVSMAAACGVIMNQRVSPAGTLRLQFTGSDVRVNAYDGVGAESRFPLPPGGYAAGPFFVEAMFDPSQSASNRLRLFYGTVEQVANVSASPGTTLVDASSLFNICGNTSDNSGGNISADVTVGIFGHCNGLPSAAERTAIMRYAPLV